MTSDRAKLIRAAEGSAGYRRAARRLRGRWSHEPRRMHRELRDLAERHDALRVVAPPPPAAPHGPFQVFAGEVGQRLEGPVLRQSQRRRLLASARKLGIGRFEANLIIAAVQHRRPAQPAAADSTPAGGWSCLPLVVMALCVESVLAWGAWRVFCA